MSVLEGPRKGVRHVVKDGSEYWVEFRDGLIVFSDGRTCGDDAVVGMDGFRPIGPGLVSGVDVGKLTLRSCKNGKMVQEGAISEQIFDCGYLIADLARHMSFLPGDILLTGTPANSRPLEAGDTIDGEVTGIGRLFTKLVEVARAAKFKTPA